MDYAIYEIDFTEEGRRRVNLFSYVLGYSRRQYLHFVESQDFETTIREHVRAFEHLGGVAATCLYDNMKVVVARYEGDEPIYNTRFLAFATHYGYKVWACRRRRPRTKGKAERQFRYVESNFLNGRSFRNFAHLNDCLAQWLAEVADVRIHRETKRRPIDLHAEELPYLIPLADQALRHGGSGLPHRQCRRDGGLSAELLLGPLALSGADTAGADHGRGSDRLRARPGGARPAPAVAAERHGPDRASRRSTGRKTTPSRGRPICASCFAELGAAASRFLDGLLKTHRMGKDQAGRVLALLETYRKQDLAAALERAARFGAFSLRAVERILAAQAQPKTPLESLGDGQQEHLRKILEDRPVLPRPTADYEQLYPQEPPHDEPPSQAPDQPQP